MIFHSDAPASAIAILWQGALSDLTDIQIFDGMQRCLKEHAEFFPTPAEFRGYCEITQYKHAGGAQKIDWWIAEDELGRSMAWHAGLKDAKGNPVPRLPQYEWHQVYQPKRVPVRQILDACSCGGTADMDLRQDPKPGPRLRVKCSKCATATAYFERAREAISEWSR